MAPLFHRALRLLPAALAAVWVPALTAGENPHGDIFQNRPVPAVVDFNRDVKPFFSEKCYHCHGPDEKARKAKLRLDLREDAVKAREGSPAISPKQPDASEVIKRVTTTESDDIMPPPKDGKPLSAREIEILRKWIAQGAPYAEHWAFVRPVKTKPPESSSRREEAQKSAPATTSAMPRSEPPHVGYDSNPIDAFIAAKLAENGLKLSAEAEPHTLLRRVALDLTGLPPTPEEIARFTDASFVLHPSSYEEMVDRFLAKPTYGERWARLWLDIARYADSAGYGSDPLRLNIWPYRDWVINAFNRNLPYDQFTIEQLAGDLLPQATEQQLVATAFHRNTMTNTEGGTDDEEFRVAAVKDRVAITIQAWMGLTMGCAQCHSHKFDPISQQEYYQFYAIFNQTEDSDKPDESPTMPLPTAVQKAQMQKLRDQIATLEKSLAEPDSPELEREFAEFEKQIARPVAWTILKPESATGAGAGALEVLEDRSVIARDAGAGTEQYTVVVDAGPGPVTAVKVEFLPGKDLPGGGPGGSPEGNAVLSEFSATVTGGEPKALKGRRVRLDLPGKARMLQLAEVQVFSGGENIAPKGTATQSGTYADAEAKRAIDGNTDGDYKKKSVAHTAATDNPFWELDLGAEKDINKIVIWNRTDGGAKIAARLDGVKLTVLGASGKPRFEKVIAKAPTPDVTVPLTQARPVKFARVTADDEQDGFEAAKAADGMKETGWAFSGGSGRPHAIVFEASQAVALMRDEKLTFFLTPRDGANHSLGSFRLSATAATAPVIEVPLRLRPLLARRAGDRAPQEKAALLAWFKPQSKRFAEINAELGKARTALASIKPTSVPVIKELAKENRRETHLLNKGSFLDPGARVEPALLKGFQGAPEGNPTRITVAQWLTSRDNPLTARVAVNRLWAQLFGIGLVETEEDFGTQGALPSHPELLDWLAVEFMDLKWDTKALLKEIVMSAAYRQLSRPSAEALKLDPRNRLLSHYPRRRLDAEQVRDQGLALSGLLSPKIGGPSVYPPQPDGLWRAAFNGQRSWETSKGEDRYRRGLYTFWRRTVPYPSMSTFDAPSRENSTMRRMPTNTPLQAFVTLNDPAFFEMAQALAARLVREGGDSVESRVRFGLELCLARPASNEQVAALAQLHRDETRSYRSKSDDAAKLATSATLPTDRGFPKGGDAAEIAAYIEVANVLLNLDGVLTKG
jgi:hypothetical protein